VKILCHAGPWSDEYLEYISLRMFPDANVLILSHHRTTDKSGLCNRYYALVAEKAPIFKSNLSRNNQEIIARCRLLRSIPIKEAEFHLEYMRTSISEVLTSFSPDLILSETIDSYIMDLLEEQSSFRKIPFIGLVKSFINGYFRISSRGELCPVREVSQDEVNEIYEMLVGREYRPNLVANSFNSHKKKIALRWFRNIIKIPYFFLKRYIFSFDEKYNYHYWATQLISMQWFHLFPQLSLGIKNWNEELVKVNKKIIYIPLQMYPEATVDYWCQDIEYINYNELLYFFIEKFKDNFHFLIKEHPNVQGYRNSKVYKKLQDFPNVTICPTLTSLNEILPFIDAAFLWTGSLGLELALKDIPVFTVCRPYYMFGKMFLQIKKDSLATEIISFIENKKKQPIEEKKDILGKILEGNLKGELIVEGNWNIDNEKHKKLADEFSSSLKMGIARCVKKEAELFKRSN